MITVLRRWNVRTSCAMFNDRSIRFVIVHSDFWIKDIKLNKDIMTQNLAQMFVILLYIKIMFTMFGLSVHRFVCLCIGWFQHCVLINCILCFALLLKIGSYFKWICFNVKYTWFILCIFSEMRRFNLSSESMMSHRYDVMKYGNVYRTSHFMCWGLRCCNFSIKHLREWTLI